MSYSRSHAFSWLSETDDGRLKLFVRVLLLCCCNCCPLTLLKVNVKYRCRCMLLLTAIFSILRPIKACFTFVWCFESSYINKRHGESLTSLVILASTGNNIESQRQLRWVPWENKIAISFPVLQNRTFTQNNGPFCLAPEDGMVCSMQVAGISEKIYKCLFRTRVELSVPLSNNSFLNSGLSLFHGISFRPLHPKLISKIFFFDTPKREVTIP